MFTLHWLWSHHNVIFSRVMSHILFCGHLLSQATPWTVGYLHNTPLRNQLLWVLDQKMLKSQGVSTYLWSCSQCQFACEVVHMLHNNITLFVWNDYLDFVAIINTPMICPRMSSWCTRSGATKENRIVLGNCTWSLSSFLADDSPPESASKVLLL